MPKYIPSKFLQEIVSGSYEHFLYNLQDTVQKKVNELLPIQIECNVLATFTDHGYAMANDGTLLKFTYVAENNDIAELNVSIVEDVQYPVIENLEDYKEYTAEKLVSALVCKDTNALQESLESLFKLSDIS